jgi:hypothetical protein
VSVVRGHVDSAGGGIVTIVVERNTMEYPCPGNLCILTFPDAPHKHNWSVFYAKSGPESLYLVCNGGDCMETRSIPNHGLFPGID